MTARRSFTGTALTLACAVLGAGVSPARAQELTRLWRPSLTTVSVSGDTIWLVAESRGDLAEGYYLVRPSPVWHHVRRRAADGARGWAVRDTVEIPLADGARLTRGRLRADDGSDTAAPVLRLTGGRAIPIRGALSESDRTALGSLTTDDGVSPLALRVSAAASSPRAFWLGLAGGFPEGQGSMGGLLRVDRATARVTTLGHEWLTNATVTSILPVGDTIFIGTLFPHEYEASGELGLVAYEPGRDEWRQELASLQGLPDDLILALARVGDSLLVATEDGPALRPLRGGAWSSWHFVPRLDTATVEWELRPRADTASDIAIATTILWQLSYVPRPADFARRFALLPHSRRSLDPIGEHRAMDIIADTLFLPELLHIIGSLTHSGRSTALDALATLRHPVAEAVLRAALTDRDPQVRQTATIAMVRRGEVPTIAGVLAKLSGSPDDQLWALEVAAAAPSPHWLPALTTLGRAPDRPLRAAALRALANDHGIGAVRTLFMLAESDVTARRSLFGGFSDSVVHDASRWTAADSGRARRIAVLALADTGNVSYGAVAVVVRLGVGPAIPRLIDALTRNAGREPPFLLLRISDALASLTAVQNAPTSEPDPATFAARTVGFWQRWRATAGARLVQAAPQDAAWTTRRNDARQRESGTGGTKFDLDAWTRANDTRLATLRAEQSVAGRLSRSRAAPNGFAELRP